LRTFEDGTICKNIPIYSPIDDRKAIRRFSRENVGNLIRLCEKENIESAIVELLWLPPTSQISKESFLL